MYIVMNLNDKNFLEVDDADDMLDYIWEEFGAETHAYASDWTCRSSLPVFNFSNCVIIDYSAHHEYEM